MKEGWTYKKLGELCYISTGKHDANHAEENGKFCQKTCVLFLNQKMVSIHLIACWCPKI